jgi:multidrug efflux pump subunit AcrB
MTGIPIAFLGSFLILPALGVSLNMISLFAFIIALGIVVDDAIIIGENVYHYRQEGYPALTAAIKGAQEMAVPVHCNWLNNQFLRSHHEWSQYHRVTQFRQRAW